MNRTALIALLLLAMASVSLCEMYSGDEGSQLFKAFEKDYGKTYSRKSERIYRQSIFLENAVAIRAHNSDSSQTYKIGLNQFADMTQPQFGAKFLTLRNPVNPKSLPVSSKYKFISAATFTTVDWVSKRVSPVKNQGGCGSCWAFSAVGALESAYMIKRKTTTPTQLSEQQLVDCDTGNGGCNGGWMLAAFNYVKSKGLNLQTKYPYTGKKSTCAFPLGGPYKVSTATLVTANKDCNAVFNALMFRPLCVAVDASKWGLYKSGIFSNCAAITVNHGVLLVGFTKGATSSGNFWRVKNSWGTGWGENGYIRLGASTAGASATSGNTCNVCYHASYPTVI